jgi:nucleoside-diphosphate-sugar epimerase|tara:strand:- start:1628 stop:2599 length:972 start_codon:yes stop_codon:yes gene_type:complete
VKKILIIGGAGFFGYHLITKLIYNNYKVDVIDKVKKKDLDYCLKKLIRSKKIRYFEKDFSTSSSTKNIDLNYTYLVNFAAIVGVKKVEKAPFDVLKENVLISFNSIKLAKKQKNLKKIIFGSSSEVYNYSVKYFSSKIPTPEKIPLTLKSLNIKRSSYMLSKIYGEALYNFSNLPIINLRIHNIYGPRMGMSHVIPELIFRSLNSKKYLEVYSPNHKRCFCFIHDAVNITYKLLTNKKVNKDTLNLGSDKNEISMIKLGKLIVKLLNKNIKVIGLKNNPGSPTRRVPSLKKLNKKINYKYNYNLVDGLKITIDWYKKNLSYKT